MLNVKKQALNNDMTFSSVQSKSDPLMEVGAFLKILFTLRRLKESRTFFFSHRNIFWPVSCFIS